MLPWIVISFLLSTSPSPLPTPSDVINSKSAEVKTEICIALYVEKCWPAVKPLLYRKHDLNVSLTALLSYYYTIHIVKNFHNKVTQNFTRKPDHNTKDYGAHPGYINTYYRVRFQLLQSEKHTIMDFFPAEINVTNTTGAVKFSNQIVTRCSFYLYNLMVMCKIYIGLYFNALILICYGFYSNRSFTGTWMANTPCNLTNMVRVSNQTKVIHFLWKPVCLWGEIVGGVLGGGASG